MPTRRPVFLLDCLLVSAWALAWIGGLVAAANAVAAGLVDPAAYVAAVLGPRP